MGEIYASGTELHVGDRTVTLPDEIEDVVEIDELIVVRHGKLGSDADPDNVRAFDREGSLVWTAEPAPEGSASNQYVGLRVEDGELWAPAWQGTDYRLDLETGDRIDSVFKK